MLRKIESYPHAKVEDCYKSGYLAREVDRRLNNEKCEKSKAMSSAASARSGGQLSYRELLADLASARTTESNQKVQMKLLQMNTSANGRSSSKKNSSSRLVGGGVKH